MCVRDSVCHISGFKGAAGTEMSHGSIVWAGPLCKSISCSTCSFSLRRGPDTSLWVSSPLGHNDTGGGRVKPSRSPVPRGAGLLCTVTVIKDARSSRLVIRVASNVLYLIGARHLFGLVILYMSLLADFLLK